MYGSRPALRTPILGCTAAAAPRSTKNVPSGLGPSAMTMARLAITRCVQTLDVHVRPLSVSSRLPERRAAAASGVGVTSVRARPNPGQLCDKTAHAVGCSAHRGQGAIASPDVPANPGGPLDLGGAERQRDSAAVGSWKSRGLRCDWVDPDNQIQGPIRQRWTTDGQG